MSVMASRPVLRWAVPAGVLVAVLGGGAITTALRASAEVNLPPRSAAQLLVDLQTARLDGAFGTVVERADLGLPALPGSATGEGSSQLNALVTGSHTLRVWYSGPDKARVALLGALGESDVIRNGTDAWMWSSVENTATHLKLPADTSGKNDNRVLPNRSALPLSPQEAADQVLAAIDPTTAVTIEPSDTVAGRGAYELSLSPKDTSSLVGKVRIAIDGTRHVPLRVQVYPKGSGNAAFEIGFTQVSFTRPNASEFKFTPPPGVKVVEGQQPTETPGQVAKHAVIGTGWTSVAVLRLPAGESVQGLLGAAPAPSGARGTGSQSLQGFLNGLPQVSGSWGSGRLLTSRLFSVLLTDDGRVLAGAVGGDKLTAAAADPAAALK